MMTRGRAGRGRERRPSLLPTAAELLGHVVAAAPGKVRILGVVVVGTRLAKPVPEASTQALQAERRKLPQAGSCTLKRRVPTSPEAALQACHLSVQCGCLHQRLSRPPARAAPASGQHQVPATSAQHQTANTSSQPQHPAPSTRHPAPTCRSSRSSSGCTSPTRMSSWNTSAGDSGGLAAAACRGENRERWLALQIRR